MNVTDIDDKVHTLLEWKKTALFNFGTLINV